MTGATVEIETADGRMPMFEVGPDGATGRGAVVVLQEAFGVNEHIEDVARRFAAAGYHAVAPHLFYRSGGGTIPYDDFSQVMGHFADLSDQTFLTDIDAALAYLNKGGYRARSTAAVGFCMGGRVSFLAAANRSLGAAVGFYGGGIVTGRSDKLPSLLGRISSMETPWLGLFGDLDNSIPIEDVEALRAALESGARVDAEIVRYPQAEHGFHCDARPSYNPDAAKDAWLRTLRWLENHITT